MKRYLIFPLMLACSISFSIAQNNNFVILDSLVEMEGYICRYVYNDGDDLYETCVFIPEDNSLLDDEILKELTFKNGSMLYKKPLDSYVFDNFILSLDSYVIAPVFGVIGFQLSNKDKIGFVESFPNVNIPVSIDKGKTQLLLYSETNIINSKYIKEGIFLVYFGKQKICATTYLIENAQKYLNVNKDWETDIRRSYFGDLTAKYTKSRSNKYVVIRYVY